MGKEQVALLSPRMGRLGAGLHLPLEQEMQQRCTDWLECFQLKEIEGPTQRASTIKERSPAQGTPKGGQLRAG